MRRHAAIALLVLAATGARAQGEPPHAHGGTPAADPSACTQFDWSLLREQAWFSAAGLLRLESGGALSEAMPAATLALKPQAEVSAPFAPSREPKPGTHAGVLRLEALRAPGLYQVTVSDPAWIDVSQDGRTTRPPTGHTARRGCPLLAKSVRFQLGTAPVTIVVSNAASDTVRIAVAPVE